MGAEAAARLGDDIAHGFGLAAMVAGAVVGALVGAAIVAATAATGGAAAVIIAGAVAGGGLSMLGIVKGLTTIFDLPEPPTGKLVLGSPNVQVNNRFSMRASLDTAASCIGLPLLLGHPPLPFPVPIAEGSATVRINGLPAARLNSKLVCGAHIKSGSPNVLIGGPTERTNFVFDVEGWMKTGLEFLGLAALVGAGVLAAAAGAAALAGFAAITGAGMLAFEGLGLLGDALGPGYRDLFQGIAGMGLLLAGPKLARPRPPSSRYPPSGPRSRAAAQAVVEATDQPGAGYPKGVGRSKGRAVLANAHEDGSVTYSISGENTQGIHDHVGPRLPSNFRPGAATPPELPLRPARGPDGQIWPGGRACAEPKGFQGGAGHQSPIQETTVLWRGKSPNPHPVTPGSNEMRPCPSCAENADVIMTGQSRAPESQPLPPPLHIPRQGEDQADDE